MIIQGLHKGRQSAVIVAQSVRPVGEGIRSPNQSHAWVHTHKGPHPQLAAQFQPVQGLRTAVIPLGVLRRQGQVEPGDVVGHESCHPVPAHANICRQVGMQDLSAVKQ